MIKMDSNEAKRYLLNVKVKKTRWLSTTFDHKQEIESLSNKNLTFHWDIQEKLIKGENKFVIMVIAKWQRWKSMNICNSKVTKEKTQSAHNFNIYLIN